MQHSCWICGSEVLPEDNFCRNCGTELIRSEKAKTSERLSRVNRRAYIGVFLVALGLTTAIVSYLMEIVPILAFGLASFLIGIMALYLPESDRSIAGSFAADWSLPSLLNIENLLEDLDLDERGIYIPTSGLGVSPKVFVPLSLTPATRKPPLGLVSSRRIFVTVGKNPEDRGILLDAPGSRILAAVERSLRIDIANAKLNDLQADLNSGFKTLGIAEVTSFENQDDTVRIEMRLSSLVDLEEKLRNLAPRLVVQVGTPVASAAASAVSKASGKYVTFKSAVLNLPERKISISLKLSG